MAKRIKSRWKLKRRGAVLPLFAFLLPVIFILCGLAINIAHMRLTKAEMKVATDAAAHAGGRAMSIHQTTDGAIAWAKTAASWNFVNGRALALADSQIAFCSTTRDKNGLGRYILTEVPKGAIDNGTEWATSIRVYGQQNVPLLVRAIPGVDSYKANIFSSATQVDRDIALVLDRSGSMLFYQDRTALKQALDDLLNKSNPLITQTEYNNATGDLYSRIYSQNVVNQLATINTDMSAYAQFWRDNNSGSTGKAPPFSRWALLSNGVNAFLDVLDNTDQEEQVALITFNHGAYRESNLSKNFQAIRNKMDTIRPISSTAIHLGLNKAKAPILTGPNARPFAAKTIVVLTDGQNSDSSVNLGEYTQNLIGSDNVTVHSITFTAGAAQQPMKEVATSGRGRHYHSDDGASLVSDFEEIANNLPTILTE